MSTSLRSPIPLARRLLCCLAASLCASCGGSTEEQARQLPASPRAVLTELSDAIQRDDVFAFCGLFDASSEEKVGLQAMIEFSAAARNFREQFINAYGQAAWDRFNAPDGGGAFINISTDQELRLIRDAEITVERGQTVATWEGGFADGELTLVKRKSGWVISAASVLPSDYDRKAAELISRLAQTVSKYAHAIGHEGITANDLDAELGHAIWTEVFGLQLQVESRFDIDQVIKAKAEKTVDSE
jgi:hypothetical protein